MEAEEKYMDELLRYLDGLMTAKEAEAFEHLIREDNNLQRKYNDLKEMEMYLRSTKLPEPSAAFTSNVMQKIEAGPLLWRRLTKGLILIFGVTIVAALGAYLIATGTLDNSQTTITIDRVQHLEKFLPNATPAFNFDGKLMMNVVIFLNLAVALIVLDRTVLKPYFQSRRTS
ncbi:MAG TPA: hypothetical protein VD927_15010 [Chryseosolibacter sp.]|nr:hypothetical protein [Chryseosolibacter sp.]